MNTPTTTPNKRKQEFDKKLKQIEADELKLKNLEQELMRLQARISTESIPLVEEFCQVRFENLTKLKQHLEHPFFKKKEKRQITYLIIELAVGLQRIGDERAQAFLDEFIPQEAAEAEEDYEYERAESHRYTPPPKPEKVAEGK